MNISNYQKPIKKSVRGVFAAKLREMPVGMAVVITGLTTKTVGNKVYNMRMTDPEKRFAVSKLDDGKVQVERTA